MSTTNSADAITLLKLDHQKVKGLFDQFEKAKDFRKKKKFAEEAIQELKVHTRVEEDIFYPTVRKKINDNSIMNESEEEHHVVKVLIAELEDLEGNNEVYEAKFMVMAENVRHHIKEEEGIMFPSAKKSSIDMKSLANEMLLRKKSLMENGVPPTPEEAMIKCLHGESPVANGSMNKKSQAPFEPAELNV